MVKDVDLSMVKKLTSDVKTAFFTTLGLLVSCLVTEWPPIVPEWPQIACKLYPSGRQSHANPSGRQSHANCTPSGRQLHENFH